MAFNPNENYNGLTKLKEFWPIVKENFQKVKDEFAENSFTEEYRSKLNGIANNATKVEKSNTNGNIKINGTETQVYVHPTDAGNKHIPAGGSGEQYLKYSGQSGTAQWAKISSDDIETTTDKQFISQSEKTKLSGIADGATKTEGSEFNGYIRINNNAVRVYTHPTGEGNKHVPPSGSDGQYLKFSEAGTAQWATISADDITPSSDKVFISQEEKEKLANIAVGATKVESSSVNGNIKINGVETSVFELPDTVELKTNKNKPNGYLGLDAGGKFDETMGKRFGVWTVDPQITTVYVDNYTPTNIIITTDGTEIINDGANSDVVTGTQFVIINKSNESVGVFREKGAYPRWTVPSNTILKMFRTDTGWAYANIPLVENNFIFEKMENKGEANGYAPLDNNKLIPPQYIPPNALSQSYANPFVATTEGSSIAVTDVQEYTNARSLIIEGKAVEKPIKNLIPGSALKFEQGTGDYGVWKAVGGANVTITQNQTVAEWGSTTATRIQTNGGTSINKYELMLGSGKFEVTYRFKIKIKNISTSPMEIWLNSQHIIQIPANTTQLIDVDRTQIGSGETLHITFRGTNDDDNLDFYVEDPFMAEYGKTSDNPHQILGVGESGNITTIVTPNLISNADFSNGTTNWKTDEEDLSVENGWLKAYHSTTNFSTVVYQDLSMSIPAQTKLFARIKMKVTHTTNSYIRLYLVGTDEAGTDTSLIFETIWPPLEAGEEYVLYGTITTPKDFEKISYMAKQDFDSTSDALGSSLYIKDCLLINMGSNESNPDYNLTADEMNTKYPDLVYETTLPAPLYALSDSKKDNVDITEGKIYKITNKIVCDGSENWGLTSSQPNDNSLARFGLDRSDFASQALGIYSHGDWFGGNMFPSRPEGAGVTGTQIVVHIAKSRISGWDDSLTSTQKVSLFKNWLSAQVLIGQPLTFVYELATPTVTDITPQTVPLYAPTTNITTNDELMPTIRLIYNRDSNEVIADLQNQINQLKTALALLS